MVHLLFNGENFRLHPASIATLAEFTLSLLILVYFLSLRNKTKDTWLMAGFVGIAMIIFLVDVGVTSSRPPVYIYFRVGHLILFFVWTLFWTWCAYTYRGIPWRREAIGVLLFEVLLLGGIIGYLLHPGITNINVADIFPSYYIFIGLQAWSILVLLRRAVFVSEPRVERPKAGQYHLFNLAGKPAKSLRALALLFALWLTLIIWSQVFGSVFSFHIGQMVLLLGVLIVHLNYASEVTTFQVKLVSLPLATTLALLGILPFLLFGVTAPESTWEMTNAPQQQRLHLFVWLIPASAAFIIISFVLFYWVGLLQPLSKLLEGVRRIESGELQTQVPVFNLDEMGVLAHSLNKMAASLKASYDELESRVAERTAELRTSLEQLQATQTQLIQKEKMASLGELTAGIAHEIQNPLNFVNNFAEVSVELLEELKEGFSKKVPELEKLAAEGILEELTQNLQKINHHGKRADSIVKGMLQHSRASKEEKQLTNLNALAEKYLRLSYQGLRARNRDFNATLITNFDSSIGPVKVVPSEIGRVLLNLFNNAFYATQQKKSLVNALYQPEVRLSTSYQAGKVEIKIRDNGTGIAEGLKSKIFQPFFTTKPAGQGTGLGLSLSYDIVTKGHGGELQMESQEGEYTEFKIKLPVN